MCANKKPIDELLEIMATLRGPEGCPWDREQTHESLRPYVVEEAYELLEQDIEHVYREGVETALRMGVDALRLLGRPAHQVQRASRTFFRHDEDSARDLGTMRHDRAAYFSAARERISALEELMLTELDPEGEERDAGWDTESLREEFGEPEP